MTVVQCNNWRSFGRGANAGCTPRNAVQTRTICRNDCTPCNDAIGLGSVRNALGPSARLHGMEEVVGSIPIYSTTKTPRGFWRRTCAADVPAQLRPKCAFCTPCSLVSHLSPLWGCQNAQVFVSQRLQAMRDSDGGKNGGLIEKPRARMGGA